MCLASEEKELGRQQASGACPHCRGQVEALDVESKRMLCFIPICFIVKRKYICSLCARRLVLN